MFCEFVGEGTFKGFGAELAHGIVVYTIAEVVDDAQGFPDIVVTNFFAIAEIATHLAPFEEAEMHATIELVDDIVDLAIVCHVKNRRQVSKNGAN
jgi:hypothetical protein